MRVLGVARTVLRGVEHPEWGTTIAMEVYG